MRPLPVRSPQGARGRGLPGYQCVDSLKAVAPVQIRSGLRRNVQVKGLIARGGGPALDHLSLVCH